jgi:Flp pilus assembly protein TadG
MRRGGATLIEFAVVVPVLLTMLIGIMEFGWLTKNTLLLANATREGTRTASLGNTTANIQTRITNSGKPLSLPSSSIVMMYSEDDGASYKTWPADVDGKNGVSVGSLIKISTTASHTTLTGFFPFLRGRKLQTYVTMRREM